MDSIKVLMVDDEKVYLEKSILFDGENLYAFLYNTTVIIDGEEIELTPLSYITVNYQDEISYYDKKNDKYVIIPTHKDDVIAIIDGFKVNLPYAFGVKSPCLTAVQACIYSCPTSAMITAIAYAIKTISASSNAKPSN